MIDCLSENCVMYRAVLDEKQWLWLIENIKPANKEIPNAQKRKATKAR